MKERNSILDAEKLTTDSILRAEEITGPLMSAYVSALFGARSQLETVKATDVPTVDDIQTSFKHVIALGYSQKALSKVFGVTTGTFSRWVSGEFPPREFMRPAIFQQIGTVLDHIVKRLEAYPKQRPTLKGLADALPPPPPLPREKRRANGPR